MAVSDLLPLAIRDRDEPLSDRVLYVVDPKTGSTAQLKDQNVRVIW